MDFEKKNASRSNLIQLNKICLNVEKDIALYLIDYY